MKWTSKQTQRGAENGGAAAEKTRGEGRRSASGGIFITSPVDMMICKFIGMLMQATMVIIYRNERFQGPLLAISLSENLYKRHTAFHRFAGPTRLKAGGAQEEEGRAYRAAIQKSDRAMVWALGEGGSGRRQEEEMEEENEKQRGKTKEEK
ncbi:hypothetical protein E2C01_053939 [Portunus trituberculatus]|uniref:Uncharacterized protein n=1 Tax=Portunus trituberculatus TaxID=210409 RepID=A0A5B7GI03_PORTR|nr:hypothetical protein [Portunus trituberculatus]